MAESQSLPVVDLSSLDRQETAKTLIKAMETVGFVYLDNVPGYSKEAEAEFLTVAKRFFSMSLEEKLRYSPKRWNKDAKGVYRGYAPVNAGENHNIEHFLMGETRIPERETSETDALHEPTPMPVQDTAFCEVMNAHFSCMFDAAMARVHEVDCNWIGAGRTHL